jgi:hypothetical protein
MTQQTHCQKCLAGRLLLIVAFVLMNLTACGQVNGDSNGASNGTAIAATIQAINTVSTSLSGVSTVAPTPTMAGQIETATSVEAETYSRTIEFSGQEWKVKTSNERVGPGPNYFSDSSENVWVDENGQLHLKMTYKDGRWYCAEVVTADPLGYGSYQFRLASRVEQLDKQAVLGLFTWDTLAPQYHYREIDIELSRWGEETGLNAQFVVQPWDLPGNRHRFDIEPQAGFSTHSFVWTPQSVQFLSFIGDAQSADPQDIVEQWSYTGVDIPPAGPGNARINLWLLGGTPPSNGQEIEVILSSFTYIPQTVKQ